jgi:hypothetical protein
MLSDKSHTQITSDDIPLGQVLNNTELSELSVSAFFGMPQQHIIFDHPKKTRARAKVHCSQHSDGVNIRFPMVSIDVP